MAGNVWTLIASVAVMACVLGAILFFSHNYTLDGIKSRTVGDGQHGTARWATKGEILKAFRHVAFRPALWRKGKDLPTDAQGLILGSEGKKNAVTAMVDCDDVHCLMIGASGIGKTAFFLYPNLEYACASGMSFLALDTKGDLARNYGAVATKYYGYKVAVIDLRNPTRSDGFNLLSLINHYMDVSRADPKNLAAKAKAEKYAKILAKTIINPDGDASTYGQNAFFYDAAEGLLTAVVLLLAEFLPPTEDDPRERRHIVSVFKLIQDLLAPVGPNQKNGFAQLMDKLPGTHKARWFAGAALNSADQAMASVMSTVLSRLNAFLDSELEQVLCFESAIDAETFASQKCAIFLILPEEDSTKNFMTFFFSQAQAESESLSGNVKWGHRKNFQDGKVYYHYDSFLGYRKGEDGKPIVDEEQAKIVRRIYSQYLMGYSVRKICTGLEGDGIRTARGTSEWHDSTVQGILRNEKYMQDCCEKYNVPYALALAIAEVESHFDPDAKSSTNDFGLMQINAINLDWLRDMGMDPLTPAGNIESGVYIIAQHLQAYGDPELALMAYNNGSTGAKKLWNKGIYQTGYSQKVMDAYVRWENILRS